MFFLSSYRRSNSPLVVWLPITQIPLNSLYFHHFTWGLHVFGMEPPKLSTALWSLWVPILTFPIAFKACPTQHTCCPFLTLLFLCICAVAHAWLLAFILFISNSLISVSKSKHCHLNTPLFSVLQMISQMFRIIWGFL